ncbi:hypothetical protein G9A89_021639 [Geosiphon pyriformis]|nr:hypothetical protein G9A89_021639 [Geosiphon pyriformis]
MNLQAISWMVWQSLSFPVTLSINLTNCFLANVINTLLLYGSFLINNVPNVFQSGIGVFVVDILDVKTYLSVVKLLRRFGIVFANQLLNHHSMCFKWSMFRRWKRLDPRGHIPNWFVSTIKFIEDSGMNGSDAVVCCFTPNDFLYNFGFTNECLVQSGSGIIDIYTNGSVKNLRSVGACGGAVAYFPCANLDVGVRIYSLLSSTLVELQAIALALDCIPALSSVVLHMDSQTFLDICASLNFKIKSHSGIVGNEHANFFVDAATDSKFVLPISVMHHFFAVKGRPVSSNARRFVKCLFDAESRCTEYAVNLDLNHPDGSICSGFSSSASAALRSYFIKALHHCLSTAKRKRVYKLSYPNILCICCSLTNDSNHIFLCKKDSDTKKELIFNMISSWTDILGTGYIGCSVMDETMNVLGSGSDGELLIVNMVCDFAAGHRSAIWVPNVRLRAYYKKHGLLPRDRSLAPVISGLVFWWSYREICNFSVKLGIHMCFGLHSELVNLHFGFLRDFPVMDNLGAGTSSLSVYTDEFLSNLDTASCRIGAAIFFEDVNLGLGIGMSGLMSSTLAELQAIALALECVPPSSSVQLFSDSQSALDACKLKLGLICPGFHNLCWIKCYHIVNVIHSKDLGVSWHKVRNHSGILKNEHVDVIAGAASLSGWYLSSRLSKHFVMANGNVVSGNSRYFVHDIYCSVCYAHWKVGSGSKFLAESLISEINWLHLSLVWHSDLHMATSFTSVLQLLSSCMSDPSVFTVLCKSFVFNGWFHEAVSIFHDLKVAGLEIVKFVCFLGLAFREDVWLVHAKHRAYMEKNGLIPFDSLNLILVFGLALRFSIEVVKLLDVTEAFGIRFGFYKSCLFFSGIGGQVSVYIAA